MKYLKLNTLTLRNFKGIPFFQADFNGESSIITGANGVGKSTVFDAFAWLVYGTDSAGRGEKNLQIKPLSSRGTTQDRDTVTSVELSCTMDDKPLHFKKEMFEQWSVPKGDADPRLEGNRFRFFYQGMPVRRSRFEEVTRELFDSQVGQLQTGVLRFCEDLHWKQRRDLLCRVAKVPSDRSFMERDPDMEGLLSQMESDSADDLRQHYLRQKSQQAGLKTHLNAKMEETKEIIRILSDRLEKMQNQFRENESKMEETEKALLLFSTLAERKSTHLEHAMDDFLFPLRLRLKKPLLDGGSEECCDILCHGIPYCNLSTGQKIKVDLFLAARLAELTGVCLPSFIDNCESLTERPQYPGQFICLITGPGILEVLPFGEETDQSGDYIQ